MQLHNSNLARGHVFDRGFTIPDLRYEDTVAPHAETERILYTVPDGKILYIATIAIVMLSATAQTTTGNIAVTAKIRDTGDVEVSNGRVKEKITAIAVQFSQRLRVETYINEGFDLSILTEDVSIGGSVFFSINAYGNLFNK